MTAGTHLSEQMVGQILTRIRKGVESHSQIAEDLGLSRHTVHRIARIHGMTVKRTRGSLPKLPRHVDVGWMERAACGGVRGFTEMHVEEQQLWCKGCPVRYECLDFGLAGPTPTIKWDKGKGPVHGGLSPRDLRKLRKLQLEAVS